MTTIEEKLKKLSDQDLIQISKELRNTSVAEDALIREVIKDTELDTKSPLLAFVAVGQVLGFELADRLAIVNTQIKINHEKYRN